MLTNRSKRRADAVVSQLWAARVHIPSSCPCCRWDAVVPQSRYDRIINGQPFRITPEMLARIRQQIRVVPDHLCR
jgi:hypothetical protein